MNEEQPTSIRTMSAEETVTVERTARLLSPLRALHRYELRGVEHIPLHGAALLVVNHSFATYDGFLMGLELYAKTGRLMRALGDDLIFKIPKLAEWARHLGISPASPTTGAQLLKDGELLGVAPGGMREALRPSTERYRVRWKERKGFVRLAIRAQVPLILVACPRSDNLYSLYESPLTKLAYKILKVPLPIIRGFGPTLLPRPAKLHHQIAAPLQPPFFQGDEDDEYLEQLVDKFHAQVVTRMNTLMHEAY